MPSIDGGPQEDPHWNEPEDKTSSKVLIKYDFENLDVALYLALRAVMSPSFTPLNAEKQEEVEQEARNALTAFELSRGPLPEWAADWNWNRSLVKGAQLMTKDGRRMGNAHIVKTCTSDPQGEFVLYECITDAGSTFTLTAEEIHNAFWVGEFLSTPERIIKDFDRNGHFSEEPK